MIYSVSYKYVKDIDVIGYNIKINFLNIVVNTKCFRIHFNISEKYIILIFIGDMYGTT